MLDLQTIHIMSQQTGIKASKEKRIPFLFEEEDRQDFPPFPFPNLGDYRPTGWKLINQYFVDNSGWGSSDEEALTIDQFKTKLKPSYGYAIIEEGEFQLYIGEFTKQKVLI